MLLPLPDLPGVFCDAHLADEAGLRFCSLWGRDTGIQELLARLSVAESEGGLRTLRVGKPGDPGHARLPADADRLAKLTARRTGTVFGDMVHLWLYDPLAVEPDRSNARALLLRHPDADEDPMSHLWSVLKQTLWVPVLDTWKHKLLARLFDMNCISPLTGWGVEAFSIDLSERDRVEQEITFLIRSGQLPVA